jgi:uncharacterized protein (DUF1330 family)
VIVEVSVSPSVSVARSFGAEVKGGPVPSYFVFHNRILDPEAMETYIPKAYELILAHGGEVLALAEDSEVLEGSTQLPRTCLIKFGTREQAETWYRSAEYEALRPIRMNATEGYMVLVDSL